MKALTIQVFVDKFTGAQFTLGSVYEAEPARIAELVAAGVVEPLENNLNASDITCGKIDTNMITVGEVSAKDIEVKAAKKPAKARTSKAKK